MQPDILHHLQQLFPTISTTALTEFFQGEEVIEYPAGTLLCRQDAIETTSYVLLAGRVDIFKHVDGAMQFVDSMTGGYFGEIALLLDSPRTADVITAEPSKVFEISRTEFEAAIHQNPEFAVEIAKLVVRRILAQQDRMLLELVQHRKRDSQPPQFFISYSRKDKVFTEKLALDLKRRGIDIWLDIHQIKPGESWSHQIGKALDQAQAMVLILSPDSLASANVDDEWNYYLDVKKMVLPVLIERCNIPFRLHKLQYINFIDNPYDVALNRLVSQLHTVVLPES